MLILEKYQGVFVGGGGVAPIGRMISTSLVKKTGSAHLRLGRRETAALLLLAK